MDKLHTIKIAAASIMVMLLIGFFTSLAAPPPPEIGQHKYNILFIAVDDLRPEIGSYGADYMHTPNLDELANRGMLFRNAYCQQSVCAPSRNSIMTGMRPDALGIYDLRTFFRSKNPDLVTLPQYFKQYGYISECVGKIYHLGHGNKDDALSWSVPKHSHHVRLKKFTNVSRGDTVNLQSDFPSINGKRLPYYRSHAPENQMTDAVISDIAIERIKALKDTSFFVAVGFIKPHLPFVAPKKYWDLYDPADIKIPKRESPDEMPELALHSFGELRKYHNIPSANEEKYLDDETTINLIHGYRACVSMIDAQVGKLLNTLDELGISEKTIIVLWGDHGWKLGEYGGWCKHTNFELDTRVPLFISAPQFSRGMETGSIAELVDIYPTLCELAGLEIPDHLEGQSLVKILENPQAVVNEVAISQYPRGKNLGYDHKKEIMGYSIFDGTYRFTRWQHYENPEIIVARELYDHQNNRVAESNLAGRKKYEKMVKQYDKKLGTELKKFKIKKASP